MGQGWNAFSTLVPSSYAGLLFPSSQMLGIMGTAVFLIGKSPKGWNFFRSLHNRVLAQPINGKKKREKITGILERELFSLNFFLSCSKIIKVPFLSTFHGLYPFLQRVSIWGGGKAKLIGGEIEFVTPTSFSFHNHIDTRSYHKKIYKLPRLLIK